MQFLRILVSSLARLGARRLVLLALIGSSVVAMLGISAYTLNRPVREVLYSGLDAEDVNRIGVALTEVGIQFDVSVAGNAVLVDYGKTAQARMILASKGLPKSDKAGYELFDQMGSLGLTSFMQQVTRVRALEGELVRTIQLLEGVKSARVHLGLKAEGTFRSKSESPTASVIIRTDGSIRQNIAESIRQLVAAAIPGLRSEQVSVMTTDGRLLTSAGDAENLEPDRIIELERRVAAATQAYASASPPSLTSTKSRPQKRTSIRNQK
jgi:flagellar M-ring protein FliF